MEKFNEIITKSLIDFEEIKFVLANNNINLVNSHEIKERYFLSNKISFKRSGYTKIMENSCILTTIDDKRFLIHKTKDDYHTTVSSMEIIDEESCIDFLNHIGFEETFTLEKAVYVYSDGSNEFSVINLVNIGLYLSVKNEDADENELREMLSSFHIPYDEDDCNVSLEKLVINKTRRYLK